jgi:hypothetical protein
MSLASVRRSRTSPTFEMNTTEEWASRSRADSNGLRSRRAPFAIADTRPKSRVQRVTTSEVSLHGTALKTIASVFSVDTNASTPLVCYHLASAISDRARIERLLSRQWFFREIETFGREIIKIASLRSQRVIRGLNKLGRFLLPCSLDHDCRKESDNRCRHSRKPKDRPKHNENANG